MSVTYDVDVSWDDAAILAGILASARAIQREVAEFLAERARLHCPVDSGELRASIAVEDDGVGDISVVVSAPHAAAVHYGGGSGGRFVPPDPFLALALADARVKYGELVDMVRIGRR